MLTKSNSKAYRYLERGGDGDPGTPNTIHVMITYDISTWNTLGLLLFQWFQGIWVCDVENCCHNLHQFFVCAGSLVLSVFF